MVSRELRALAVVSTVCTRVAMAVTAVKGCHISSHQGHWGSSSFWYLCPQCLRTLSQVPQGVVSWQVVELEVETQTKET